MENCYDIYDKNTGDINEIGLKNRLNKLKNVFSNEYFEILASMCEISENKRPDFRLLDRRLSECVKIFGKRICEIIKVTNFALLKNK